jgi:nucleotide-binding universal stress UspA family protein
MKSRIVVPVDGSECSAHSLDAACELAQATDAGIVLHHVVSGVRAATLSCGEPSLVAGCLDALRQEGKAIVAEAYERACRILPAGRVESSTSMGDPIGEIARAASGEGVKWIVMGSHGRSGVSRLLMGSVAEGVLHRASVPVMIVPPQRRDRLTVRGSAAAEVPV